MLWVFALIDAEANGETLHDLHVVAACVFGRKETEERSCGPRHVFNRSLVVMPKGVYMDRDGLAGMHLPKLRFLEVRSDPDIVHRNHSQQRLARLNAVS